MKPNTVPMVKPGVCLPDVTVESLGSDQTRAIAEVKGAIMVAQNFPRDENRAFKAIQTACQRVGLAEQSQYAFPRGGTMITGPSIRLAETLARYWGNLQYGVREIATNKDETKYEAFCWDMETNVRASRSFSQRHERHTKKGVTKLDDPRDIYETVANSAARRLRAAILQIIPGDIVESAIEQCNATLKGGGRGPIEDRVRKMVVAFAEVGVDEKMLEERILHPLKTLTEAELSQLKKIYVSLRDGMSKPNQWFGKVEDESLSTNRLNERYGDARPQKQEADIPEDVPDFESFSENGILDSGGTSNDGNTGKGD